MANNRNQNNPPYNHTVVNGVFHLNNRPIVFDHTWRFADQDQKGVPSDRFHDPADTRNNSKENPPPGSQPVGQKFRTYKGQYIAFNDLNGYWETVADKDRQRLSLRLPVPETAWIAGPPTPQTQTVSLLEESNPDEPIATSSQTLPEPIEPTPVPSITVSSPILIPTTPQPTTKPAISTTVAKIELKTKFDGDASRVKEIVKHCDWKFALDGNFDTNFKKAVYLLSCCEGGTAGPWAVEYSEMLEAEEAVRGAKQEDVYAWTKVKKAFTDYFLPRSQVSSAIAAMNVLKQTGTVKEYVAKFRSLASQSGQPVAANETYFIKGLNKGLQYKIVAQDPNGRDTYEKLYALTERLDEAYQMLPKEERQETTSRKSYQQSPARYQSQGKKNYRTSIGRLNPEQR